MMMFVCLVLSKVYIGYFSTFFWLVIKLCLFIFYKFQWIVRLLERKLCQGLPTIKWLKANQFNQNIGSFFPLPSNVFKDHWIEIITSFIVKRLGLYQAIDCSGYVSTDLIRLLLLTEWTGSGKSSWQPLMYKTDTIKNTNVGEKHRD